MRIYPILPRKYPTIRTYYGFNTQLERKLWVDGFFNKFAIRSKLEVTASVIVHQNFGVIKSNKRIVDRLDEQAIFA
jgi:hypothetical protein